MTSVIPALERNFGRVFWNTGHHLVECWDYCLEYLVLNVDSRNRDRGKSLKVLLPKFFLSSIFLKRGTLHCPCVFSTGKLNSLLRCSHPESGQKRKGNWVGADRT